MTLSRPTRSGLLLLLLLVVATGVYLYRNLDSILQQQVRESLRAFGVQDYRIQGPRLGAGHFTAVRLALRGTYNGLDYDIALDKLAIDYDWRILLTRQARRVSVSALDVRVSGIPAAPPGASPAATRRLVVTSLLPREMLAQLPSRAVEIDHLRIEYRPPDDPLLVSTGHLHHNEQTDIRMHTRVAASELDTRVRANDRDAPLLIALALRQGPSLAASIDARLATTETDHREWRINAEWEHEPLLQWVRGLPASLGIPVPEIAARGNGRLDANIRHPNTLEVGHGSLWQQLLPVEIEARLAGAVEELDLPGLAGGQLPALALALSLAEGALQLEAAPLHLSGNVETSLLPLSGEARDWLTWGDTVAVNWHSPEPVRIRFDGKNGSLQASGASLRLGNDQSSLALQSLALQFDITGGANPELDNRLNARIDTRLRKQQMPSLDLALRQAGPVGQNRVNLELESPEGRLGVEIAGSIDLVQGEGVLDLAVRSDNLADLPDSLLPALSALKVLSADLVLEAGSFALESRLESAGTSWTQTSIGALAGVSGEYGEYRFDNLSLNGGVTGNSRVRTVQPLSLSVDALDVGFVISEINARASMPRQTPATTPSLAIEDFSASLFGGRIFQPAPGSWDFGRGSNSLTLRAEQWQLSQLVALQQSEDIQARGVLEGELPVTLVDGRLTIEKGYLRALPPGGTIRYAANDAGRALGRNSRELDMALRLLSDFRYDVLSSDVELDRTGNLRLGLSLAGHNPQQYDGRAVNFNINLEQNLDPLLQSLRLSGKLTEEIESRLR